MRRRMAAGIVAAGLVWASLAGGAPARAEEARYPTFVWETPKFEGSSALRKTGYYLGSVALSLVTVPAKTLATVALTPVFLSLKARDAFTGRDDAQAFAERTIAGDYAVLPTHLSGDRPWRLFGAP